MGRDLFRDLLRLDEGERRDLLDRLDHAARVENTNVRQAGRNCRTHERFDYRRYAVPIRIDHPGGSTAQLLVCTRNISSGGLAFVNAGFVHHGTRCRMVLAATDGTKSAVAGEVVNSRHLKGALHEVSVRFDRPIDVEAYVERSTTDETTDETTGESGAVVAARVLCMEPSEELRTALQAVAGEVNIGLAFVDGADELETAAAAETFDAVILAISAIEGAGGGLCERLRRTGYQGPIVAAGQADHLARLEELLKQESTGRMTYPVSAAALRAAVGEISPAGGPGSSSPSDRAAAQAKQLADLLAQAVESKSDTDLRWLCTMVLESSDESGLGDLADAAGDVLKALDRSESVAAALPQIERLQAICASVASGEE